MDIQGRKIEFIQEFLKIQSVDVISRLEKILKNETKSDHKISLEPLSIDELNKRIDKSENDFKNGRYKSTSELLKKYNS